MVGDTATVSVCKVPPPTLVTERVLSWGRTSVQEAEDSHWCLQRSTTNAVQVAETLGAASSLK